MWDVGIFVSKQIPIVIVNKVSIYTASLSKEKFLVKHPWILAITVLGALLLKVTIKL